MRYQLRYIRAQRTRSSPGAKDDDSPPERAHTNLLVSCKPRLASTRDARGASWDVRAVLVFDVVRPSAPVPWLSGRASASHAEGRWFDPSRDHPRQSSHDVFRCPNVDPSPQAPDTVRRPSAASDSGRPRRAHPPHDPGASHAASSCRRRPYPGAANVEFRRGRAQVTDARCTSPPYQCPAFGTSGRA
jgi:hypothetical protein